MEPLPNSRFRSVRGPGGIAMTPGVEDALQPLEPRLPVQEGITLMTVTATGVAFSLMIGQMRSSTCCRGYALGGNPLTYSICGTGGTEDCANAVDRTENAQKTSAKNTVFFIAFLLSLVTAPILSDQRLDRVLTESYTILPHLSTPPVDKSKLTV